MSAVGRMHPKTPQRFRELAFVVQHDDRLRQVVQSQDEPARISQKDDRQYQIPPTDTD